MNDKNIEIIKLNQKIQSDKEIFEIKQGEIKDVLKKCDMIQKELEIYKVRYSDKEKQIDSIEIELGESKDNAIFYKGQMENIIGLINTMMKKDRRNYGTYFNQIQGNYKKLFVDFNKTFGIFK